MFNLVDFKPVKSNFYGANKMSPVSFTGQVLKDLQPKRVWELFEEITKIPRPSDTKPIGDNNKEISNYLVNKLKESGFEVTQLLKNQEGQTKFPGKYNVYATRNVDKNKRNAIILQAHMDMVAVSADDNVNKPIKLHIDGDKLTANDRTLGADNGIGLAIALAIAESDKFKNLPLQIIFTVNEENGMHGVKAVTPDVLKGQYLINLDSEEYGEITIGCAAGIDYKVQKSIPVQSIGSNNYKKICFSLKNARGGHSGTDIHKDRINPIQILLKELSKLSKDYDIKISSINAGEKRNSIPRNATFEVLVPENIVEEFSGKLKNALDSIVLDLKDTNSEINSQLSVEDENVSSETKVLDSKFQTKMLIILADQLFTGPKTYYDNGNVKTSQNLGILKINGGKAFVSVMMRTTDKDEREIYSKQTSDQLSNLFDEIIIPKSSPIWQPNLDSNLVRYAESVYKELGVNKPVVNIIHAGLENAHFARIADENGLKLDHISVGPTILEPHTTKEYVEISTVEKFYDFMNRFLSKLKG